MDDSIKQLEIAVEALGCISSEVMLRQRMLTEQQQRLEAHPTFGGHPALVEAVLSASNDVRRLRQRARDQLAAITALLERFRQMEALTQANCAHIAGLCHQALETCLMNGLDGTHIIEIEAEFLQRCQE